MIIVHLKVFQWYVLPWFQGGSPIVEQLGVVNSSLTELNTNLTLNCEIAYMCDNVHTQTMHK